MTIVVVGNGPPVAWARDFLATHRRDEEAVVITEYKRESLEALLATEIRPLVVVDHEPDMAALRGGADKALCDLLRPQALRFAFVYELARQAKQIVRLRSSDPEADWTARLKSALDADPTDAPAQGEPSGPPRTPGNQESGAGPEIAAVTGYLLPLCDLSSSPGAMAVRWNRELFLDGDLPGKTLPATVEIGGRPRILAYGPYLPLPVGRWTATVYLGFGPEIGRLPFILELDAGGGVARGFVETERGGLFSVSLDFDVLQALQLVEFRLISQESVLDGQLSLIEIEFERRQD